MISNPPDNSQGRIDFQAVNEAALCRLPELLENWIPGGRREGVEYIAASLAGGAGRSFSVNLTSGLWADFASGDKGGDPVSLFAAVRGIRQGEAARELARELGLDTGRPRRSAQAAAMKVAKDGERLEHVTPVPADAPRPPARHGRHGEPSTVWAVSDRAGALLGYDVRFDHGGGKDVLPLTLWRDQSGRLVWRWKSFPTPRPLYGLERIDQKPGAGVLLAEGPKTADAAVMLAPKAVALSWLGGCKAVHKADWTPLAGRSVVVWPDADKPGVLAALEIGEILAGIGCAVSYVAPPADAAQGWDLGDAAAEGWTVERVAAFAKANRHDRTGFLGVAAERFGIGQDAAPAPQDVGDKPRDEPRRGDVPPPPPGAIVVAPGRLHLAVEEIERALSDPGLSEELRCFQQPGRIVRLARGAANDNGRGPRRHHDAVRVADVTTNALLDLAPRALAALGRSLVKFSRKSWDYEACDLPRDYGSALLARDGSWTLPALRGVVEVPILMPDGRVIQGPGHDAESGFYLACERVAVPECPSRDDALEAANALADLLAEFPFVSDVDQSAALALLLGAGGGYGLLPRPIAVVSAPTPGSGKSKICETGAALATGRAAACIAAAADPAEDDKQLASALLAQDAFVMIDNRTRPLGSGLLAQAATASRVKIRPFGRLADVVVEISTMITANGNGIQLRDDLLRRVVYVRLDAGVERPEARRFRFDPVAEVLARRDKYLKDVLTILRAYVLAGCPGADSLEPMAGFTTWRRVICGALVWLGLPDPLGNRDALAAEDLDVVHLGGLLAAWNAEFGQAPKTAAQACATASVTESGALHEAIAEVCGDARGNLDSRRLGYFLRTRRGRIVGGLTFERAGAGRHGTAWTVRRVA